MITLQIIISLKHQGSGNYKLGYPTDSKTQIDTSFDIHKWCIISENFQSPKHQQTLETASLKSRHQVPRDLEGPDHETISD